MTLHHLDYDDDSLPDWAKGLGSLNREVLLSHGSFIPGIESKIRQLTIQCITVSELLASTNLKTVDALITDTEGHDLVILRQFDFSVFRPRLVIYESKHLNPADFDACETMLVSRGYRVKHLNNDNSVAVLEE